MVFATGSYLLGADESYCSDEMPLTCREKQYLVSQVNPLMYISNGSLLSKRDHYEKGINLQLERQVEGGVEV